MILKKYVKSRRKFKVFLLLFVIILIVVTIVILKTNNPYERIIDEGFIEAVDTRLKLEDNSAIIIPEKYNEHKIKTRLIEDKIKYLTQSKDNMNSIIESRTKLKEITSHVHIFYNAAPILWHKRGKTTYHGSTKEIISENGTIIIPASKVSHQSINTAFYPALGLYKPTKNILQKHFQSIRDCGIGVVILTLGPKLTEEIINMIFDLVPEFNLTVTFEIVIPNNRSLENFKEQLLSINKYTNAVGFYRVFSLSRNSNVPLIYVSNAYKLDSNDKNLCKGHLDSIRTKVMDAIFIGHIRIKGHAEIVRRLCFDGFYTRSPSNGAVFASTWKNWTYLKSFAMTYKMMFIPTVGPGYAERNKFPRHGDVQRHRSNGRYYGVAWRTAILNHIGFINVASYNSWQDGSQIEEAIPKGGFMDYSPGTVTKYLDLTTHWVGNFLKTEKQPQNCYAFFNNTIC